MFGISRYSDDDPDHSRNDLGSMYTFLAAPLNHESIHPDWVGKLTPCVCDKHQTSRWPSSGGETENMLEGKAFIISS